jgi:hypothetical protein
MKTRVKLLIALILVTALLAWFGYHWLEQLDQEPINYTQIEAGLWMGGHTREPPPGTYAALNLCEIKDAYSCEAHGWAPIRDAGPAPTIEWLREKVEFVERHHGAGKTTYIHCFNGASRSGMVVTAYLMKKHGWSRDEAIAKIKAKREQLHPNPAFMDLLEEWQHDQSRKR